MSPWNIDRETEQQSPLSKCVKMSSSATHFDALPVKDFDKKINSEEKRLSQPHEIRLQQVRRNMAQSCISLNFKYVKREEKDSPVQSPRINKKVRSQLKLEARKLEGD